MRLMKSEELSYESTVEALIPLGLEHRYPTSPPHGAKVPKPAPPLCNPLQLMVHFGTTEGLQKQTQLVIASDWKENVCCRWNLCEKAMTIRAFSGGGNQTKSLPDF